ncbi:MAG: hypothetical protein ABI378_08555, partial [Chitinophagaceae bacterium]
MRKPHLCSPSEMDIQLSAAEAQLLQTIHEASAALNMPTYLIGGFVRDKIIGRPTKDADIVCLGDGIELAHAVAAAL